MTSDHIEALKNPGPFERPRPRIRDTAAIRRKVRTDSSCRACGLRGSDGHHVLYRSLGGDDVEDNIVCLCHHCHMMIHKNVTDDAELCRREIGKRLKPVELRYVCERRGGDPGRAFLERYYSVPLDDPRYQVIVERRNHPRGIANLHALTDR